MDSSGLPASSLVTEEEIARMTGLEVSQVRLMISGAVPIPPYLEGVIPAPATEVTGFVWNRDDVDGLEQKVRDARAAYELDEQSRAEAEILGERRRAEAEAFREQREAAQRSDEARRLRVEQQQKDAEAFAGAAPPAEELLLPAGIRKRDKPRWFTAFFGAPKKSTKRNATSPASAHSADFDEAVSGDTTIVLGSNTRRARAAFRAEKRRAKDSGTTKRAKIAEPPMHDKDHSEAAPDVIGVITASQTSYTPLPQSGFGAEASVGAELTSSVGVGEPETGEDLALGGQRAKQPKVAKAPKEPKQPRPKRPARDKPDPSLEKARKAQEAQERKSLRAQAIAEKKRDRADSKAAKKARDAAYQSALARWKEELKIAKATGTRPPRKPKKPRNSTSKPKPVDINNATRALATMLENTPGELDAVGAMVQEYEGTLIGEAFRRIKYRISDQNATLVQAFAPEKIFPAEVHNMLAVGQKTIEPGAALRTAVKLMDASSDARRKLRSEISEPVVVGVLSLVALFATAYLVMPGFVEMYASLEMEVPPVSAAILVMSDAIVWILGILAILTAAYVIWWFSFGRHWDKWRTALDYYSLHMPLLGDANMAQQSYQLLKVLGAYINVGAPEREALVDAAEATKNRAIKKHLLSTAEMMMAGTRTFADTFDSDMFPSLAKRILAIGEKAGRVPETVGELEKVYDREAEVAGQQAVARVSGTVAGVSSLIFTVVVVMVTIPPLEMFGSTLSYGQ